MHDVYSAFWDGGHATISVIKDEYSSRCLWSVSLDGKKESPKMNGVQAETLELAISAIERRLGFRPDFRLEPKDPIERMRRDLEEMFPDSAFKTKILEELKKKAEADDQEYTWVAKWRRGSVEVSGSDRGGYLWDVFKGTDNDIVDFGTAETKEEAFEKCSIATKQKLHFELK